MAIDQRIILVSPAHCACAADGTGSPCWIFGAPSVFPGAHHAGFLLGVAAGTLLAALSARFRRVEELLAPALLPSSPFRWPPLSFWR